MGGGDPFGLGGAGGASSFPAPGNPSTAQPTSPPASNNNAGTTGQTGTGAPNPGFGGFPFLFGQNPGTGAGAGGVGAGAGAGAGAGGAANPFGFNPALMEQLLAGFGGAGASPFGGFGGAPAPGAGGAVPAPADARPAEERFQVQLQVC
jgi:ubiquilin